MHSMASAAAPTVHSQGDPQFRGSILLVILLRTVFFWGVLFAIQSVTDLGSPVAWLGFWATAGVVIASRLSFSSLSHIGFGALTAAAYGLYRLLIAILPFFSGTTAHTSLIPVMIIDQCSIAALIFAITGVSTWLFWRVRDALTLEVLTLLIVTVIAFSAHRNFHLSSPQAINSLAWYLNITELRMFTLLGASVVLGLLAYLLVASLPASLGFATRSVISRERRSQGIIMLLLGVALVATLVGIVTYVTYQHFFQVAQSRIANGVGEETREGMSPLGFHSALGSTNQPAALVRLEGDYKENPFSPMLYLREAALSDFNGKEMVIAGKAFDSDLPWTSPSEHFAGIEQEVIGVRVPVVQSIYLIAEQKTAFAVDEPVQITPLKNPNTSRFRGSYRAYSMAPTFEVRNLLTGTVGNSEWSEEIRRHYLKPPTDPRYEELARKITEGVTDPVRKAQALAAYLSEQTTYTLTPNHEDSPNGDQTAPYLFGDMRGYCVHFAHAMAYMLRSVGIPARIGTGYLTDLSQAKDGHILLRMSDRHAWAEVYVEGAGWVPFDVQPAKVESHAESPVDMKLLEELMGMLDPGEEILPKDSPAEEPEIQLPSGISLPFKQFTLGMLLLVIFGGLCAKLYIRFGWLIARNPRTRIRRSYRSLAGSLRDLGVVRHYGETRQEFRKRAEQLLSLSELSLPELIVQADYSAPRSPLPEVRIIDQTRRNDLDALKILPWWRRALALCNPVSIADMLVARPW
jgi:hypothetical protein